jgi:chemotaxis protein histidine kinase CheA
MDAWRGALELLPDSQEALSASFRTAHSLKGTAGLSTCVTSNGCAT